MIYIATFYSHFGAIRFRRLCEERGWPARMMPVPRALSSSCGTCVRYETDSDVFLPCGEPPEELEQIALMQGEVFRKIYRAED